MKVAVVINENINHTNEVLSGVKSSLTASSVSYDVLNVDELNYGYDIVCAIGGDGTILKVSRFYARHSVPVMGINLGRLGFLSLVSPYVIDKLGEIIKTKQYVIRERMMLKSLDNTALNDIVIKGHSSARTSRFNLYINNNLVCDYIADGIIISTPTGSTAYGLSAGGPILHPGFDAMVIVPICAHTMSARPLVVPSKEIITVKSEDEALDMTCDGQVTVKDVNEVVIEQSQFKAKLAFPKDYRFYSVLHKKLRWGTSPVSED